MRKKKYVMLCMTRISQQECQGILENENRYLRSLAEMPALEFNFH
ncbi:MAG: hypothetical protein ACLU80_10445 [Dorea sp.]